MQALACYPVGMTDTPRRPGRPAQGVKYPKRLVLYGTERDEALLQALSARMDRSQAGVLRQLLREKAREMGLLPADEPDGD